MERPRQAFCAIFLNFCLRNASNLLILLTTDVIEKVVSYLAKNPEMESRLLKEQGGNEKMAFLMPSSPFFAFYKQRLVQEKSKSDPTTGEAPQETEEAAPEEEKKQLEKPADFNWILPVNPLSIPTFDYDLVSLVAQYVAKTGRSFQMGVMNRESRNMQYGFLTPQHPLHDLYQRLVADYSRIIIKDTKTLESHTNGDATSRASVLDRIKKRRDWKAAEKEKEAKDDSTVSAVSVIDWNDAIIVETITFDASEDHLLPAPIEQGKLLSVYLATKQREEEARQKVVEAQAAAAAAQQQAPSTLPPGVAPSSNITSKEGQTAADIQRAAASGPKKMTAICPICRLAFPVDEIDGHMKVEMSRGGSVGMQTVNRQASKPEYAPVVASGDDIAARLIKFAKRRNDLFDEDESGEKSLADRRREERERSEREAAMAAASASVSHNNYRPADNDAPSRGYAPNAHHPAGGAGNSQGHFASHQADAPSNGKRQAAESLPEDAPMAKKSKMNEVIDLLPEKEYAEQNPGPVSLSISLEEGESFELSMPVMTSVKVLKDSLAEKTSIPVNKQILKSEHLGFLKDKLTLAHYNLASGSVLSLSTKERGGKKK